MIEIVFPDALNEQLAFFVACITVVIGLGLMAAPRTFMRWLGLGGAVESGQGISEVRGPFGGVWVGLGLSCILLAQPFTYFALGVAFLMAVIGRIISFFADKSLGLPTIAGTVFEGLAAWAALSFAGSALGLF